MERLTLRAGLIYCNHWHRQVAAVPSSPQRCMCMPPQCLLVPGKRLLLMWDRITETTDVQLAQLFQDFVAHTDLQLIGRGLITEVLGAKTDSSAKSTMVGLLRSRFTWDTSRPPACSQREWSQCPTDTPHKQLQWPFHWKQARPAVCSAAPSLMASPSSHMLTMTSLGILCRCLKVHNRGCVFHVHTSSPAHHTAMNSRASYACPALSASQFARGAAAELVLCFGFNKQSAAWKNSRCSAYFLACVICRPALGPDHPRRKLQRSACARHQQYIALPKTSAAFAHRLALRCV